MAYFARKLRYAAHDGDANSGFVALIELARKKGGRPIGFVLYRLFIPYNFPASRIEMIRLTAKTAEDAVKRFWPGEDTGEEYPGFKSRRWEKTTRWLYPVVVAYERFSPGTWVRVGTSRSWRRRRKKKSLQFGNISHILIVHQARLCGLEQEKFELECEHSCIPGDEAMCAQVQEKIEEIREEISSILATIDSTKAEMRYRVYQMFPEKAGKIPRRVLRKQRDLQGHQYPAMV